MRIAILYNKEEILHTTNWSLAWEKYCKDNNIEYNIENPYSYIKMSDAFLFTSLSEGFPNVLLESIASSTPVLTYNSKSGPDEIMFNKIIIIKENIISKVGILIPLNDENKFIDGINFFLKNRNNFNDKKEFLKVINNFKQEEILKKYYKILFNNLCAELTVF